MAACQKTIFDWPLSKWQRRASAPQSGRHAVRPARKLTRAGVRHHSIDGQAPMTRTLRFNFFTGVVIASIWTATVPTTRAQDAPTTPRTAAKAADRDSVSIQEVQKAAEQLADAVQAAVRKATEDPAVKVAALKVARNAVMAAQVVITQQAETLQTVLDALAREIAMATERQQAKARTRTH